MNDQYLSLSSEDLLLDDAVQAYLLSGKDAKKWLAWEAKNPEAAARLDVAREQLSSLQTSLNANPLATEAQLETEEVWTKIAARTAVKRSRKPNVNPRDKLQHSRRILSYVALASFAAILIMLVIFLLPNNETYETNFAEQLLIDLPDGSRVTLGPQSTLEVIDYESQRTLTLSGEAFFEVEKGNQFTVQTEEGSVAVLGTSFTVNTTAQQLAVACATGRVQVSRERDQVFLTPGQAVSSLNNKLAPVTSANIDQIAAWRTGMLYFDNRSLAYISKTLERYYGRQISLSPKDGSRKVTINLPTDDLPVTISRLSFVLQAQIDTSEAVIRIQ